MTRLSDFAKNYQPKEKEQQKQSINQEEIKAQFSSGQQEDIEENVKKTMEKYENMDQGQLYQQLFQEASKLKANGQFNYDALYSSIENMGSYLSPDQKEKMLALLNQLR